MGKNAIITKEQELVLSWIGKNDYLKNRYYFTGGTALALHYLKHRESVDLDFFCDNPVEQDVLNAIVSDWSRVAGFEIRSQFIEVVMRYEFAYSSSYSLKVDFSYYQCKRLEQGMVVDGVEIDSLTDIAVNKLLCIMSRCEVKDFVDLYYLLVEKNFSIYDLIIGLRYKFNRKADPYDVADSMLQVNQFSTLPNMIRPLKLQVLKDYFNDQAKTLGSMSVE